MLQGVIDGPPKLAAPGNWTAACRQIQSAPSARSVTVLGSRIPSRPAQRRRRGPKRSAVSIAANNIRACGAGRERRSQVAAQAGGPGQRLAKTPRRISRQPSQVLTMVPSVANSTSPLAAANASPAAGAVGSQSANCPASAWQTARIVGLQLRSPQNSARCSAACANDQLAPARPSSLRACGLTKPCRPR
jgi:hypothetical protein